jgi:defect-in-organelle-trafficking protein DotB
MTELRFPEEPVRFLGKDAERLLLWSADQGASDITIQTGSPVTIEVHGRLHSVTARVLSHDEVVDLAVAMYRSETAKGILAGNSDLDFSYEIRPDRFRRQRFRMNATPNTTDGNRGLSITARTIDGRPRDIATLGLEPEIIAAMAPLQGMVVVTGATGSGKSTLLSSIIRNLLEDPNGHRKILTYEAPIEFVYDDIVKPTSLISQTEIPAGLPNFASAIRNALRRAPEIILVGEARDAETIGEAITASMTGHLLYTTVHSNGFADTIRRMVNVFHSDGEKSARAVDIVSSLRMVVSQRLVPSLDGKRVALREFVVFDAQVVDSLMVPLPELTAACRQVLRDRGQSFLQAAEKAFAAGLIGPEVLTRIQREDNARLADQAMAQGAGHE